MKIAPASLTINQLFGAPNEQYFVPTYQRRYSWHERQVGELIDDILLIEDGDTHLLGTIVCLTGHHKAGLNRLELVDGQQRLTTVAIILECIRQRLDHENRTSEALEIAQLLTAKPLNGPPLKKVELDSLDCDQYSALINQQNFDDARNYELTRAFEVIRERASAASLDELLTFLYRLRNQAVVIRLDVSEAKDAFRLFETINDRGLRLSPTDIIKNFLLGNAARFSEKKLEYARRSWTAVLANLDGTSADAFFRYYLMALLGARITASEVVFNFKSLFMKQVSEASSLPERKFYEDEETTEVEADADGSAEKSEEKISEKLLPLVSRRVPFTHFVDQLVRYSRVYGELVLAKTNDDRINRHLHNLQMIKANQTYGFLMHLRSGECSDKIFRQILRLTEAFILRRHVCRERANDTEALFARLCTVDPKNPLDKTKQEYRDLCPNDDKFREEFSTAHFSANLIDRARYCLERMELAKHGKHEELEIQSADEVHVEHIMPQKIRTKKSKDEFGDWITYLGKNAETMHGKYIDRIGNLTLFAGALNIGASNNPFARKKQAYKASAILLTRELVSKTNFKFTDIATRSKKLADEAVILWPMP
jgi:hypothetical protein